jgi:hypothetical protein
MNQQTSQRTKKTAKNEKADTCCLGESTLLSFGALVQKRRKREGERERERETQIKLDRSALKTDGHFKHM